MNALGQNSPFTILKAVVYFVASKQACQMWGSAETLITIEVFIIIIKLKVQFFAKTKQVYFIKLSFLF